MRAFAAVCEAVAATPSRLAKRAGVLSDYTFAVRDGDRLAPIGKAYSGLTDAEIAALTTHFLATTVEDHGALRVVQPTVVLEVAFDTIQRSDRHGSGYALRFPRILRSATTSRSARSTRSRRSRPSTRGRGGRGASLTARFVGGFAPRSCCSLLLMRPTEAWGWRSFAGLQSADG